MADEHAEPAEVPPGSWAASAATRASMLGNRRRDTRPELAIRQLLHAQGLRYRVDYALPFDRRRKADIVFTRWRIAVFIDGCYWHGCPQHGTIPKTNTDYWSAKIAGNRARDADTNARLAAIGWTVLRFWEHEASADVATAVAAQVRRARERAL